MKTELNDRILWNDGTNQVPPDAVPELLLLGVPQEKIVATELNADLIRFNQLADIPITVEKRDNGAFDFTWNVPDEYKKIDLRAYAMDKLRAKVRGMDERAIDKYGYRIQNEMAEIKAYGLEPLFQALIYAVDRLKASGKVWGVGRGSSCASLILHLIGVHEVDPIRFNIPMSEFFHD